MKRIKLTQGQFALVDGEDFPSLNKKKWCAGWDKHTKSFYAISNFCEKGKWRTIRMARVISKAKKGQVVDHKNHNTLDNRRENLRICDYAGNAHNSSKPRNNTSGYKGVSKCSSLSSHYGRPFFQASIRVSGKLINLGYGEDKKSLGKLYNAAALKHFGEFAYLNDV